ncbi:hypothetical protein BDQ17DRAFT_1333707 [Cyathus striatus]|nr:hypothetical protein BDQ17DRAFT_1333707 [Cyathus striatus]
MEAVFDNKTNVLNASIRNTHDSSPIYHVTTSYSLWSRKVTLLKDVNPTSSDTAIVGAIYWKEKTFEVNGHKKPLGDIRRKEGNFLNQKYFWRWTTERKEYEAIHKEKEWQVIFTKDSSIAAQFAVPYRPHLLSKSSAPQLSITTKALTRDEVFLILLLIYSEVKRQDRMNSSGGW